MKKKTIYDIYEPYSHIEIHYLNLIFDKDLTMGQFSS